MACTNYHHPEAKAKMLYWFIIIYRNAVVGKLEIGRLPKITKGIKRQIREMRGVYRKSTCKKPQIIYLK